MDGVSSFLLGIWKMFRKEAKMKRRMIL